MDSTCPASGLALVSLAGGKSMGKGMAVSGMAKILCLQKLRQGGGADLSSESSARWTHHQVKRTGTGCT